ncbi:homoserine dehydrogenase-domain-containing protein [Pisolithus orientalis]|uniref:homoserine dehydrogenase-domain-containing protein n=1 Tax=Pisolithus orientalis TaxID=936130 RepID=UPI00222483E8|nr:homoserine dehydrogenase-domain-containing protein [Pisolithus orientalis]KAI6019804.1 homoserine dehydrogenase-domain-containing protein [Pisolithus orientalis]
MSCPTVPIHKALHVAVVGVGLVGREFMSQMIASRYPFVLTGLCNSKRMILNGSRSDDQCFNPSRWEDALAASNTPVDLAILRDALAQFVKEGKRAVLVDNTASEDIALTYPQFLDAGVHVVTPNKKAFSGEQDYYLRLIGQGGGATAPVVRGRFLNESTVGAGLPIVSTLRDLVETGDKIKKIEGVFSGTMSYIFNNFSTGEPGGISFSDVVAQAKQNGYTEPNPMDDLNGADVARKLTILSRMVDPSMLALLPHGYKSVDTQSLIPLELESVKDGDTFIRCLPGFDAEIAKKREEAAIEGCVLRYVGIIDVEKKVVKAGLEKYPKTHAFATSLGGSDNIIMFHSERYSPRPLIVQGAGAGAAVTAMGVMSDLLKLL